MILSLLTRSLVRTGLAITSMRRQLDRRGRRPSLGSVLLAARLREADDLVAGQLRRDDQADHPVGLRLGGWTFHR